MDRLLFLSKGSRDSSRIVDELVRHNFSCTMVHDADVGLQQVELHRQDLILIEIHNIQEDERLCRYLRNEKNLPIIAIAPIETAISLDGTIDDFVLSPLNVNELVVRIKRIIKKKAKTGNRDCITIGKLVIDVDKYEVSLNGKLIPLTFREYELLKFLAMNAGRVFTRDALLNGVWGEDFFGGDRTVDVHIRRLRSKIEDETNSYIETVRNIGYRLIKRD